MGFAPIGGLRLLYYGYNEMGFRVLDCRPCRHVMASLKRSIVASIFLGRRFHEKNLDPRSPWRASYCNKAAGCRGSRRRLPGTWQR